MSFIKFLLLALLAFSVLACKGGGGGSGSNPGSGTTGSTAGGSTGGGPINTAPNISDISNQSTNEDTATSISFIINDSEDSLTCASSISKASSDTAILPLAGIAISGTSPNCALTMTPVANVSGTATVTLTVSDGSFTAIDTFNLVVNTVNDAPAISSISDQRTQVSTALPSISFTISDVDSTVTCAGSVTKSSSNTAVVANTGIVISGTAPNCSAAISPVSSAIGTSTITLTVSDGASSTNEYFDLVVYNPWTTMSTINAPTARSGHSSLWTGNEMIVWGSGGSDNSGGMYDPSLDSWTVMSTTSAPTGRYGRQRMVWDGTYAYVLGGILGSPGAAASANAKFNPATNTWSSIASLPVAKWGHSAVWTGSRIIVWGGTASASDCGPAGNCVYTNTGHSYNPSNDTWTAISTTNAPQVRIMPMAIWTGTKMLIWGGFRIGGDANVGGLYDPTTDTWASIAVGEHDGFGETNMIWTGDKMFVWGGSKWGGLGYNGKLYDPDTNVWSSISSTNAPNPTSRNYVTTVWSGTDAIVWGGNHSGPHNTGALYNPTSDTWIQMTTIGAPAARYFHTAVWTGTEMIIWGGNLNGPETNTGAFFTP